MLWSEELLNQPLNPSNWNWRVNNTLFMPSSIAVNGNRLLLTGTEVDAEPGPPTINYSPPPFDLVDLAGNPAAAFSGFPIT